MTTHRFVGKVRRAIGLETDALALAWAGEAVAAFLNAIPDSSMRAEMALQLPDRLFLVVKQSQAAARSTVPRPGPMSELLGIEQPAADHLLRIVWTVLQDVLSPSDLVRATNTFSPEIRKQLARYEALAEEEEDALHGDVADYQYDSETDQSGAILTGGDVDADWKDAEGSGEETVGGSVITPDQDVVEEIGEALGVTYRYDEPLRPVDKELERDRSRWEMDPASSEDFKGRDGPGRKRRRKRKK